MKICKYTDGTTCKEKHRTFCIGLVLDCDKYEKPEEKPKTEPKAKSKAKIKIKTKVTKKV